MATYWFFNFRHFPFTSHYGRHTLILLFKLLPPPTLWFWLDEYAVLTYYDWVNAPTAAISSKPWLLSSPAHSLFFLKLIIVSFFPSYLVADFSLCLANSNPNSLLTIWIPSSYVEIHQVLREFSVTEEVSLVPFQCKATMLIPSPPAASDPTA